MNIKSILSTVVMSVLLMGCTTMKSMQSMNRRIPECPKCGTMVQEMVNKAIALYDSIGKEAFERFHTDKAFRDGELYIFVHQAQDGIRVSHSVDTALVGHKTDTTVIDPAGIDTGKFIREVATEEGNWVRYRWEDPITKKILSKKSWVRMRDGYVFGCGLYERMMKCEHVRAQMAQDMVGSAIALYDNMGKRKAFERFQRDKIFRDGELYISVLQANDSVFVAHGMDQSLVGKKADSLVDPDGVIIGKRIREGATEKGNWVEYRWEDPITKKILSKKSWVRKHDGYIFLCGIYDR